MVFNNMSSPAAVRLQPVEPRHAPLLCFGLLVTSCALASFALACATPFAAFAAIAAATLPWRPAFLVVVGAWLINQAIGFGVHHYPVDASTIAWGFVIGAAALAATAVSIVILRALLPDRLLPALALALICAYAAYELVVLAATPVLGGEGAFTTAIVTRIGSLNVAWLIGLVAACEIVRLVNPYRRGQTVS